MSSGYVDADRRGILDVSCSDTLLLHNCIAGSVDKNITEHVQAQGDWRDFGGGIGLLICDIPLSNKRLEWCP